MLQGCTRPLAHDQGLEKWDIDYSIADNPVVQNPPSSNVTGGDVAKSFVLGQDIDKLDHS